MNHSPYGEGVHRALVRGKSLLRGPATQRGSTGWTLPVVVRLAAYGEPLRDLSTVRPRESHQVDGRVSVMMVPAGCAALMPGVSGAHVTLRYSIGSQGPSAILWFDG